MKIYFWGLVLLIISFSNCFSKDKYYYNYYIGLEGPYWVTADKDSANFYSKVDLDTLSYGTIRLYYKTGELFADDFYDFRSLSSSRHFYKNGKKRYTSSTGVSQSAMDVNSDFMKIHWISINNSVDASWDSTGIKMVSKGTGHFVDYYPNGNIMREGNYEKGIAVGDWKAYYESGKLMCEGYYTSNYHSWTMQTLISEKGDTLVKKGKGKFTLEYPNGNPSFQGEYNGNLTNEFKSFYPNGNIREKSFRLMGYCDGKYETYYSNGVISCSGNYIKGKKVGEWKWFDKNGKLKGIKNYGFVNVDVR